MALEMGLQALKMLYQLAKMIKVRVQRQSPPLPHLQHSN